jgi:hypothetical protein
MKRILTVLALTFAACAPAAKSDAVLLMRVRVPYEAGDRPLALVQVNRDEAKFAFDDKPWASPEPFKVDLRKTEGEIELAVRTDDPDGDSSSALRVRIAFCDPDGSKPCDRDEQTPELSFIIEHPFYAGELTEWDAGPKGDSAFHMPDCEVPSHQRDFPRLGNTHPLFIKACNVAGCLEVADQPGAAFTPDPVTGYCREDTNVHFCAEDS